MKISCRQRISIMISRLNFLFHLIIQDRISCCIAFVKRGFHTVDNTSFIARITSSIVIFNLIDVMSSQLDFALFSCLES